MFSLIPEDVVRNVLASFIDPTNSDWQGALSLNRKLRCLFLERSQNWRSIPEETYKDKSLLCRRILAFQRIHRCFTGMNLGRFLLDFDREGLPIVLRREEVTLYKIYRGGALKKIQRIIRSQLVLFKRVLECEVNSLQEHRNQRFFLHKLSKERVDIQGILSAQKTILHNMTRCMTFSFLAFSFFQIFSTSARITYSSRQIRAIAKPYKDWYKEFIIQDQAFRYVIYAILLRIGIEISARDPKIRAVAIYDVDVRGGNPGADFTPWNVICAMGFPKLTYLWSDEILDIQGLRTRFPEELFFPRTRQNYTVLTKYKTQEGRPIFGFITQTGFQEARYLGVTNEDRLTIKTYRFENPADRSLDGDPNTSILPEYNIRNLDQYRAPTLKIPTQPMALKS